MAVKDPGDYCCFRGGPFRLGPSAADGEVDSAADIGGDGCSAMDAARSCIAGVGCAISQSSATSCATNGC